MYGQVFGRLPGYLQTEPVDVCAHHHTPRQELRAADGERAETGEIAEQEGRLHCPAVLGHAVLVGPVVRSATVFVSEHQTAVDYAEFRRSRREQRCRLVSKFSLSTT